MTRNPVEENPVTRWILGLVVIVAMLLGGGAGGWLARQTELPYAAPVGVLVGALVVFVAFAISYRRWDATVTG